MVITQEADYAVRIIRYLAECDCRQDARNISENVYVTLRFSLKILGKLSAAGIVKSYKGHNGGYELARDPEDITLKQILTVIEGPLLLSKCLLDENRTCYFSDTCVVRSVFADVSQNLDEQLDNINMQGVLDAKKEKDKLQIENEEDDEGKVVLLFSHKES